MGAMTTPVLQPPTGDPGPVTQVQCAEQILPSKKASNSVDHGDISSLVLDMPKESNSGEMHLLSSWHYHAHVNHFKLQTLLIKLR